LILGALVGFAAAVIIQASGSGGVGAALLTMAVFGATISYALVMWTYIALKKRRPDLHRPYQSPLGVPGAYVGLTLALISLLATLALEGNRPGVIGTAIFVALMFIYYQTTSRHRLVAQSPEEEFALRVEAERELR
jgi:ethanolamine permease